MFELMVVLLQMVDDGLELLSELSARPENPPTMLPMNCSYLYLWASLSYASQQSFLTTSTGSNV
jgi:hypothetical protein